MKRAHRLHGGARLKLRIMLPVNQIFPNMSLAKICLYTKLQSSKPALMYHRTQQHCAVYSILIILIKNIEVNTSQLSSNLPQSTLFRAAAFRCVHSLRHACR